MRQFLSGAAFGAAVSALAVLVLTERAPSPSAGAERPAPSALPSSPAQAATAATATDGVLAPPAPAPIERAPAAPAAALQEVAQPARAPAPPPSVAVAPTPADRLSIPGSTGLSDEHAKMLMPRVPEGRRLTLPELHAQPATEGKDAQWAAEMEQNLTGFIAQHNASGEFEVLTVECRTTLCEILAFGNLPDSQQRWNLLGAAMSRQPWWASFKGNSTSSSGRNGRTTIVTILQRADR